MDSKWISRDELVASGWNKRQVEAALDEPDAIQATGFLGSANGKPFYDRGRVTVAAYRIGLRAERPAEADWREWVGGARPTSLPVLTVDFHRFAEHCLPDATHRFAALRLMQRIASKRSNVREQELDLIAESLILLVREGFGVELADATALKRFLEEHAASAAELLGPGWPDDVVVRAALRSSYLSRATGKVAIQRAVSALSLVHVGAVVLFTGERVALSELLTEAPRMRFDRESLVDS